MERAIWSRSAWSPRPPSLFEAKSQLASPALLIDEDLTNLSSVNSIHLLPAEDEELTVIYQLLAICHWLLADLVDGLRGLCLTDDIELAPKSVALVRIYALIRYVNRYLALDVVECPGLYGRRSGRINRNLCQLAAQCKAVVVDRLNGSRQNKFLQIGTAVERCITYFRHTVRNGHIRQIMTVVERPCADLG